MLADILLKTAGMTAEGAHKYFPRPSMAGTERCIRQMVYHAMGVDPDHDLPDRMIMVWDDGHWHEELTNDWIRKTIYRLHSEQMSLLGAKLDFIKDGIRHCDMCGKDIPANVLHGHIDGIVTDQLGEDVLFDHKAINHFTFQRYWNGGEEPIDYFVQLSIYSESLQRTANPKLTKLLLLIKNKNTAQYMEYLCDYNIKTDTLTVINRVNSNGEFEKMGTVYKNIVTDAVEKFKTVDKCARTKKLPKRQYYKDHWRCEYCRYMGKCWEGYEGEQIEKPKKLPATLQDCVKTRSRWKGAEGSSKVAEAEIKDYMRLNNLLVAKSGDIIITRKIADTKSGDKFSFKWVKPPTKTVK